MNIHERKQRDLRFISRCLGLAVALTGVTVLVGWALGVEYLKSVVPGLVTMKANTAACFILAGLSLASARGRTLPIGLAGLILLVSVVTFAEYATGLNVGLDELLFKDPVSVALNLPPGRMAMATALAFILTGTSLILVARRRSPVVAQILTFAAVLIPLFSLLAYLFGERAITLTSPYTSLAVNTAFAFAILGCGILCECSEAGPMSVLFADEPGGMSLRRLLPLSVATTLLLGFASFLGAKSGLYTYASGIILFAVATTVVLSAAIWTDGWLLNLAEAVRRRERDWLQLTLKSIGDAVIATDREGRVQFLNPVAERLTGWASGDAAGVPLTQVFRIINEASRMPVEDPVGVVLRTGHVVGLANHTLLIAKDGSERPISDSAAPIKDGRGETTGVVLVFSDMTERHRAEEATRRRAFQLQKLAEVATRIGSAHDVNSVLGVVTGEARLLFGAHQAATSMVLDPAHPQPINVVSNSAKHPEGSIPPDIDGLQFCKAVSEANEPIRLTRAGLAADARWRAIREGSGIAPAANGWLAAPLIGRNGRNMGLIQLADKAEGEFTDDDESILVQLSQLAAIALENARLYQELRTNDERKDEFLAMLAHELRNPLAAIANAVKLASKTEVREHLDFSRDVISRQMHHLTRLIEDLMDVSRITRGKIELRRDVMEVSPILESAVATVRTLAEERKHALEMDIERGSLWANVDPTRLEQVVVNLLNNAAKYSENSGLIRLTARVESGEVVVGIKDRGVGIPPERLPEMFELFAQGDRSLARSEGGLGIGLTVVKKLVEMHGGSITAKSEGAGKGSEFTVRLPTAKRPVGLRKQAAGTTKDEGRKVRILVVDDNADTARGMARLLKLIGHEVAVAHDGPEAIEAAKAFTPEFVLLDIGLPGMSGYEVASKLRREECCREAVIVAVSGYGQDEDRRRSKEAGFDFHLTKPLDHDALISLLAVGA